MRMPLRRRGTLATAAAAVAALGLSACGSSEPPPSTNSGQVASEAEQQCQDLADKVADAPDSGADTFVFAGSADPVTMNPFHASDGETFRISRQIFEGLVGVDTCTADPAPLLATDWEQSEDGKSTTFQLQEGVTFQDGTPFNAQAVCDNFEYFNNQPKGPAQSADISYYWLTLFKGFEGGETESIFDSCETSGDTEVTINLTQPFAGFVASMSLPAFSMQSPTALAKYDKVAAGEDPTNSEYATAHPTGTGPYMLQEWNRGKEVRLVRYDDYWGDVAKTPNVVVPTIADPGARRDALLRGEIDGYDLVAPGDLASLDDKGIQLVNRPAFNILYLGFNQAVPELADIKVREAIAHAINKDDIVAQTLPPGSEVAQEFMPPSVNGWTEDVAAYDYDPDLAKQMLADAGAEDLTLQFNYPTDVSRPYMPSPEDTFNTIRTQLEAVGITVEPVADTWSPDYLEKIQGTEDHGIHLLGWTGDYNDTDNFLGVFFGAQTKEWGFDNPDIFDALTQARQLPTIDEQTPVYEKINQDVMDFLPGIPIAHPVPTLGFGENVQGFVPSPVQDEPWNQVVVVE
jgi:peptide/nickel transport system substrate-binding protein